MRQCSPAVVLLFLSFHKVMGFSSILSLKFTTTPLRMAIIYGWDDYEEEGEDVDNRKSSSSSSTTTPKPFSFDTTTSDLPGLLSRDSCDAQGAAVAEELTTQKLDSLARLAFSFRPKEHEGLKLQDIEQVHVLCVNANEIQMEAILCENMGCVSLHIPVAFPTRCEGGGGRGGDFQTCVLNNIQALDASAETTVQQHLSDGDKNLPSLLSQPLSSPPNWWVEPSNDEVQKECSLLQDILTEDLEEFKTELLALAKEGLAKEDDTSFQFEHARCAKVGPAGMGLKAVGRNTGESILFTMDVWFPFGGTPHATAKGLRAAVLGAVASASD
jgi:hypothetical protein